MRGNCSSTSSPTRHSAAIHTAAARRDTAPLAIGPRGGACYLCVQIAVDNVVIDAARTAHRDRAEQHPGEQFPLLGQAPCQADTKSAGPKQQPPTNRPVEARQQGIRAQRTGQQLDKTAMLTVGRRCGGGGHIPPLAPLPPSMQAIIPCQQLRTGAAGEGLYTCDRSRDSRTVKAAVERIVRGPIHEP